MKRSPIHQYKIQDHLLLAKRYSSMANAAMMKDNTEAETDFREMARMHEQMGRVMGKRHRTFMVKRWPH